MRTFLKEFLSYIGTLASNRELVVSLTYRQIYARYRQGHTRDPRFARLIEGVRACSSVALQAATLGRIERLF